MYFSVLESQPEDNTIMTDKIPCRFQSILLTLITVSVLPALGQKKDFPVNISVFNEATAIPFTKIITLPVHPGLQAGIETDYRSWKHSRIYQTANLSYFFHNHLNQGLGLDTEFGYEYRAGSGFSLGGLLGIGYMHTFATTGEYIFKGGQYEEEADHGNARFFPSLSLDAGYYINPGSKFNPRVFIRYKSWIEYPYSPDFIPVMAHINLHAGVRFNITNAIKADENHR